jgi:hypothetical protein
MLIYYYARRDEKIRTSDLQHPMLARYRATLHPEMSLKYNKANKNPKFLLQVKQGQKPGPIALTRTYRHLILFY